VVIARGLPASPGCGHRADRVFCRRGRDLGQEGKAVILVRQETSPEDLRGMSVAKASSPRAAA
jgi:pyruvate,orthophosphate dikinase